MTSPKRHHYVPRMLLRQWEDGPGSEHVWVMDRRVRTDPRRAHIDDVTVIKHFYTGNRDRDGRQPDFWAEDVMAEWESKAAAELGDLLNLKPQARAPIVPWVYFQLLRTPQG